MTEVTDEGKVYGCSVSDGPALEKLMDNLREEFSSNPPVRKETVTMPEPEIVCPIISSVRF